MFKLRTKAAKLLARADARMLAAAVGNTVAAECGRAIRMGYNAQTGAARPRKADGKPEGFATGRLAEGLEQTVTGSATQASIVVVPPADRAEWVGRRGDVIVADGQVGKRIAATLDEFVRGLLDA
jgi:hypothetical protein